MKSNTQTHPHTCTHTHASTHTVAIGCFRFALLIPRNRHVFQLLRSSSFFSPLYSPLYLISYEIRLMVNISPNDTWQATVNIMPFMFCSVHKWCGGNRIRHNPKQRHFGGGETRFWGCSEHGITIEPQKKKKVGARSDRLRENLSTYLFFCPCSRAYAH